MIQERTGIRWASSIMADCDQLNSYCEKMAAIDRFAEPRRWTITLQPWSFPLPLNRDQRLIASDSSSVAAQAARCIHSVTAQAVRYIHSVAAQAARCPIPTRSVGQGKAFALREHLFPLCYSAGLAPAVKQLAATNYRAQGSSDPSHEVACGDLVARVGAKLMIS